MSFNSEQEAIEIVGESEFYIFDFGGYPSEHYTTRSTPVITDVFTGVEEVYTPLPIKREGIRRKQEDPEESSLIFPKTDTIVQLLLAGGLDTIRLTIIRGFGTNYASNYRNPWWVGDLVNVTVGATAVKGNLRSSDVLFDDTFPKVFHQPGCNNTLGVSPCPASLASYLETRTVTAVAAQGRLVTLSGSVPAKADYFSLGKMRLAGTGDLWRHISMQAGLDFVLQIPIPGLTVGSSVELHPGCAKRITEDCIDTFNAKSGNVSMANIPKVNPVIDGF